MKKQNLNFIKGGQTMRNLILTHTFLVMAVAFCASTVNGQQTAQDIMVKVDQQPDGDSRKSVIQMELINKRGSKRVRTMLSYSKDYGKDKKTIMYFQEPADVNGTGFLTWDYSDDTKTDDRWLYLPALKKTRRISGSSAKKENFMGSDFTYDDMGNRNIEADYHKVIKEVTLNGKDCWVIESIPKNANEVYSKKVAWICKVNYMVIKVDFYDKQKALLKTLEVNDIKKVDGFWTAGSMTMTNHQVDHKTIMHFNSVAFNITLDDNLFTVNTLEKGYIK